MHRPGLMASKGPDLQATPRCSMLRRGSPCTQRANRVEGSCAFEHVFGEVKRGKVNGFIALRRRGMTSTFGFSKVRPSAEARAASSRRSLSGRGEHRRCHLMGSVPSWRSWRCYTLCVLKPDDSCTVSLGGKTVDIRTHGSGSAARSIWELPPRHLNKVAKCFLLAVIINDQMLYNEILFYTICYFTTS